MGDRVRVQFLVPRHLFRYVTNQPPKANSAFHPSGVSKWVPALAGKTKAGMAHSVSGWTLVVQVKLWDPLRTRAIPEHLGGAFMTRCYTNPLFLYLTIKTDKTIERTRANWITRTKRGTWQLGTGFPRPTEFWEFFVLPWKWAEARNLGFSTITVRFL